MICNRSTVIPGLLIFLLSVSVISAENAVTVSTESVNKVFRIGDAIRLLVHVDAPEEIRVLFPGEQLDMSPFSVLNRRIRPPEKKHNALRRTMELTISVYDTGNVDIPEIEIAWETPDGVRQTTLTDPIPITIESLLTGDEIEPRSVKPPLSVPARTRYILYTVGGILVLLLVLALLAYAVKKLRKKTTENGLSKLQEPHEPADREALNALEELKKQQLPVRGDIKKFFVILAAILKTYIGRRYAFNAPERTTGELRKDMRHLKMEPSVLTLVSEVLELSDMVKFARYLPAEDICRKAWNNTETIIMRTREPRQWTPENDTRGGAEK